MIDWNKPFTTKSDMSDVVYDIVCEFFYIEGDLGGFCQIRIDYTQGVRHFFDEYLVDYETGTCLNPYLSPEFDIINEENALFYREED